MHITGPEHNEPMELRIQRPCLSQWEGFQCKDEDHNENVDCREVMREKICVQETIQRGLDKNE